MRILLSILAVLMFFGVSCGDSARAKHKKAYDLSPSNALLDVGEALLAEDANWDRLAKSDLLGEHLSEILRDEASRLEFCQVANQLLQEERFHDFASLIDEVEKRGGASSALMELRDLPQALQALSLFCARRPYQKSDDLDQAMNFLSPWVPELSRLSPEVFPPFWESQEALLEELRLVEKRQRIGNALTKLDRALTTRGGMTEFPAWYLSEIAQVDEKAEILQYVNLDGTPREGLFQGLENPASWTPSRELSVMLCWNCILGEARDAVSLALESHIPDTLSGQVLKARATASPEVFLQAFRRWQEETPPAELLISSPSFFGDYLQVLPNGIQTRENSVPGIPEIVFDFLQLIP